MQREAKPRFDPSEHAKKQLAAKERAKELRDARQRGVVNETCTFAPKVNPRKAAEDNNNNNNHDEAPPGSPPIRSKFNPQHAQPPPSPPIKSKYQAQQSSIPANDHEESHRAPSPPQRRPSVAKKPSNPPPKLQPNDSADSLDRLSGSYSRSRPPASNASTYQNYEPEEPEHDALSKELKTRTGKTIGREAKPANIGGGGECLRNSSCRCRQCDPSSAAAAPAPLARQRTMKQSPSVDLSSTVDQNSLSLLKSKMSRRKSRSAPTKPASMFVDEDKPRHVVHSARDPPPSSVPSNSFVEKPPRRQPPPPAEPAPPAHVFAGVPDGESEVQDDGAVHECPDCHRKFNSTAIVKHQKICKKVFQGPKKVFNMAAARLKGTEVEKLLQEKGMSLKAITSAPANPAASTAAQKKNSTEAELKKQADWKKKSSAFRDAIKSSREYEIAKKEGRALPPPKPAEIDPSLIQCQHCSRRFNEKAAERHIPHCKEKAERAALANGPPKKAPGNKGNPPPTNAKIQPPKQVSKIAPPPKRK